MSRPQKKKIRKKPGLPPGSLVFTGEKRIEHPYAKLVIYNDTHYSELDLKSTNFPELHEHKICWFDIRGLSDLDFIGALGTKYHIHNLVLEDTVNVNQFPKFEEYSNGIFIVMHAITIDPQTLEIHKEQVAIFFNKQIVLTFQEDETDLLEPVRTRLANGRGRIRSSGADYLAYAFMDTLIDHYFIVIDKLEEAVEELEKEIIEQPHLNAKAKIYDLKRKTLTLRRDIHPLREAVNKMMKVENEHIGQSLNFYLRDLYDHAYQIIESLDNIREMLIGLYDLHQAEVSQKLNNVMKFLTIISTIFIPLTFLAGVYGMNFKNMPELEWEHGYFYILAIMALSFLLSLWFFKYKKWF